MLLFSREDPREDVRVGVRVGVVECQLKLPTVDSLSTVADGGRVPWQLDAHRAIRKAGRSV